MKNEQVTNQCWNCGWEGIPQITLENIPDLYQRIEPGGEVPSGECPKCGALCYEVKIERRSRRTGL